MAVQSNETNVPCGEKFPTVISSRRKILLNTIMQDTRKFVLANIRRGTDSKTLPQTISLIGVTVARS